jgi:exosortase A
VTVSTLPATTLPRALKGTSIALALGLAVLALLFQEEIGAAIRVWTNSTAYNHCFLVLPIALYLAWDRRATLIGVPIRPVPWLGFVALPVSAVWLVADQLGIMEGRQLMLMCLVELLFLAVLGWRMFGKLAAPLLYLFFLVPFGAFIVPWLQSFTAKFIDFGLSLTSLPYFIDNYVIEIPEGTFYVAEACAGLRFLIASIAFGVLYAVLIYRSWPRRAIFIAISIVVPIIANGLRALGIVWLGHLLGSAQAAAADHIIYGWIFFSIVILLLVVLGLPFRQDTLPVPTTSRFVPPPPAPFGLSLRAAGALAVVAMIGPLASGLLSRAAASERVSAPALNIAGCQPDSTADASMVASEGGALLRFSCEGGAILLRVAVFPPRTGPSEILAEQRRMTGRVNGAELEVTALHVPGTDVPWRLVEAHELPPAAAASALWIDGRPTTGGLGMRLRQAKTSLSGGTAAPVVVAAELDFSVAKPGLNRNWPSDRLRSFIADRPALSDQIGALAADAVRRR